MSNAAIHLSPPHMGLCCLQKKYCLRPYLKMCVQREMPFFTYTTWTDTGLDKMGTVAGLWSLRNVTYPADGSVPYQYKATGPRPPPPPGRAALSGFADPIKLSKLHYSALSPQERKDIIWQAGIDRCAMPTSLTLILDPVLRAGICMDGFTDSHRLSLTTCGCASHTAGSAHYLLPRCVQAHSHWLRSWRCSGPATRHLGHHTAD